MRPKGKLLALFAMFAAVGLITATGAFTTVEADRTATVEVAGDDAALLGIDNATGASDYVDTSGAETRIVIDSTQLSNADGVNTNATTDFGSVLNITNNGQSDVGVYVELSGSDSDVAKLNWSSSSSSAIGSTNSTNMPSGQSDELTFQLDLDSSYSDDQTLDLVITIIADESEYSGS